MSALDGKTELDRWVCLVFLLNYRGGWDGSNLFDRDGNLLRLGDFTKASQKKTQGIRHPLIQFKMEETAQQTSQAESDQAAIDSLMQSCTAVREQLAEVIVGQEEVVEQLLIVLLARGHALLGRCPVWPRPY